jgi:hypothetical protein
MGDEILSRSDRVCSYESTGSMDVLGRSGGLQVGRAEGHRRRLRPSGDLGGSRRSDGANLAGNAQLAIASSQAARPSATSPSCDLARVLLVAPSRRPSTRCSLRTAARGADLRADREPSVRSQDSSRAGAQDDSCARGRNRTVREESTASTCRRGKRPGDSAGSLRGGCLRRDSRRRERHREC